MVCVIGVKQNKTDQHEVKRNSSICSKIRVFITKVFDNRKYPLHSANVKLFYAKTINSASNK